MDNALPEPTFLSAPKAATLCGVSRNTICCWIRDGKLPSYRTAGGKNLIRPSDLLDFMRDNRMFIPQALEELAKADQQSNEPESENRTTSAEPSILVVDDDPQARILAVKTVQKLELPVLEAETGFEAMHIMTKHPEVALIILDLVMPGQHGTKTLAEIRKKDEKIPVIVVTGYPPDDVNKDFAESSPDLVITKPYTPSHLLEAARAFLSDIGI